MIRSSGLGNAPNQDIPMDNLKKILQLHIDIPSIVVMGCVFLVVWQPLARSAIEWLGIVQKQIDPPIWVGDFFLGIMVNLVSAVIIVPFLFWVFGVANKSDLVGKFKAFDLTGDAEEEWGDVSLTYNLLSNRIKGTLTKDDLSLALEAYLEKGQYLRGHYIEQTNFARRRIGAFLLQLNGSADRYQGKFVFVDPDDQAATPQTGDILWVRVN